MLVRALAVDFDGTIALDGRLNASVGLAIRRARASGLIVILATGRRLDDLRGLLGDLMLFDAVVAENGAVVHFPESGRSTLEMRGPPHAFVEALRRRGMHVEQGVSVVEADAESAPLIVDEIRRQELPLVLLFNRGRAMVLPQGASKASGLRAALDTLRVSPHNTIAIGDAENDYSLLEACEIGVAVGWGSPGLQRAADEIVPGSGPAAVAVYIDEIVTRPQLALARTPRHWLKLGIDEDGAPFELALRDRNVLVVGDPRSGKSWLTGLLAEQLILLGYCLCIVDPEGDYATLRGLPRVVTLGGEDQPPQPKQVCRALHYPDTSLVVDLSHVSLEDKREEVATLLPVLASMRADTGIPHRIFLDEAHYFIGDPRLRRQLHLEDGGYVLATYRMDQLPREALTTSEVILATRVTDPREVDTLAEYQGTSRRDMQSMLGQLALDEAVLLPGTAQAAGAIRRVQLLPRLTLHVRHRRKYLDVPVLSRHAFVFTNLSGVPTGKRAATLSEFVQIVRTSSPEVVIGHLSRGDISRWMRDVFGDVALADTLAEVERQLQTRTGVDWRDVVARCIEQRYASETS